MPFPADTEGFHEASVFIENEGELLPDGAAFDRWKASLLINRKDSPIEHRNWKRWRDVEAYLEGYGYDLVRWFRALAVFPVPSWELTLRIGHELGIPVTWDRLLVLSRMPILQSERIDERLRQDMLKGLNRQDEDTARWVVQEELSAVQVITSGTHAQAELETALAIQAFALDPYEPANQDAIRFLLTNGHLSRAQEAELNGITNKVSIGRNMQIKGATSSSELPPLTIKEWLANEAPPAESPPPVAPTETEKMESHPLPYGFCAYLGIHTAVGIGVAHGWNRYPLSLGVWFTSRCSSTEERGGIEGLSFCQRNCRHR
ncbi:MAG: hypothetical protein R2795_27235 [Saprospiraceae bacterium]